MGCITDFLSAHLAILCAVIFLAPELHLIKLAPFMGRRLLERREPGRVSIQKDEGPKSLNRGLEIPHLIGGGKRIDISM